MSAEENGLARAALDRLVEALEAHWAAVGVRSSENDPAVTAAWKDDSIVGTVDWVDRAPVQAGVGMPRIAAASDMPYWVGLKNELSVTWFTNVNFHAGTFGKLPPAAWVAPAVPALLLDELLHASMSAEAAAVALNRPAPSSSRRREGPSFMFRVSIASSTTGSIFFLI